MTLQFGETLDLQLAFRPASASYIEVRAIVDLNRNGRADPGEPGANAVPIAFTRGDEGYHRCDRSTVDGISTIGPLINASISVAVEDFCGGDFPEVYWFSDQPPQEVSVGEGETVSLTLLVYRE